ncbi:MAG TPA: hypothetical protein VMT89_16315 [Candidatus Acidoferrales bacterium]|nr:hypothetical protein [Candidatus Acidoferrales bacterium]
MSQNRPVPPSRHPAFFTFVLVAIAIAGVELASYAVWKLGVPGEVRRNIKALCRTPGSEPEKVPNTFWHHALNPNSPAYQGLINSKGTKGPDFAMPKPAGELRIICVGDSTVEGIGVAPQETFPAVLEQLLKPLIATSTRYHDVRVINAGIGSHNSAFSLAYLLFRLIHYQPDIVLIKSAYNDYLPYCIPGMQYDYLNAFPQPFCLASSPNPYWRLARYSNLLKIVGALLFRQEVANPFTSFSGAITPEQLQRMDYSANADKFYIYAENIRSMILACKGRGIQVAVLDLPTSPDPQHYGHDKTFGQRFRELIARLEVELRRVTSEEGVPLITTGPLDAADFFDHCHNTASGNRRIAQRIYETLAPTIR